MNILSGTNVYVPFRFSDENSFEKLVVKTADKIFGENTIYIDIKKKLKSKTFNIIPDWCLSYNLAFAELSAPTEKYFVPLIGTASTSYLNIKKLLDHYLDNF